MLGHFDFGLLRFGMSEGKISGCGAVVRVDVGHFSTSVCLRLECPKGKISGCVVLRSTCHTALLSQAANKQSTIPFPLLQDASFQSFLRLFLKNRIQKKLTCFQKIKD